MLYDRLDEVRADAAERRRSVERKAGNTPQAAVERDAFNALHAQRLAALDAAARGLCFGRLDLTDGPTRYVGRVGLQHRDGAIEEPILLDWRAPAAQPFYLATAVEPAGVGRRRRIATSGRTVTGVSDEIFDADAASRWTGELVGEAALLSALSAARTGRMGDVVETIQAEQDRIIRAERQGVLVVAGGPGTGKTAVALHRAAYLLYAHRDVLARRVVLVIGPSPTFCDYIGQVLPSLGETDVLLRSIGGLVPDLEPNLTETPEVAELKGRLEMAEVVAAALRARQEPPADGLRVRHAGYELRVDAPACRRIADSARRSGRLHNEARPNVQRRLVDAFSKHYIAQVGGDPRGGRNLLDEHDQADLRSELADEPAILAAVESVWPWLTPEDLIGGLFADPDRIAAAAPMLTDTERALLVRRPGLGWSDADVPLLDEAAELLGDLPDHAAEARARALEAERRELEEYAEGVLAIAQGSRSTDIEDEADSDEAAEVLSVFDVVSGRGLAGRMEEIDDRTPVERAAADRTWVYGHVIVDEAQELTAMAWRALMRRIPTRSMTIVGDLFQSSSPGGALSWGDVLGPYVRDGNWRVAELTVNYRAPSEVMAIAGRVLAEIDPDATPPRSVRTVGELPWKEAVDPADLGARLRKAVDAALADGDGNLAVLVAAGAEAEAWAALEGVEGLATVGTHGPDLRARVVVLTVGQSKGLEFDTVIVVEPAAIVEASARGRSDLYVALTRATTHLGVLHTRDLPASLAAPDGWA
ncbi:ATP-binding domain-containing protein [Sporichthya polymorpha]|uniref:ATP-binding domain-containing protein n=1 Tax=Sporichthya polymorpha TaxID=35751 RepID=UPI000A06E0C9